MIKDSTGQVASFWKRALPGAERKLALAQLVACTAGCLPETANGSGSPDKARVTLKGENAEAAAKAIIAACPKEASVPVKDENGYDTTQHGSEPVTVVLSGRLAKEYFGLVEAKSRKESIFPGMSSRV